MEAERMVTRCRGKKDARQIIVRLTKKGQFLQEQLTDVPETVSQAVLCESVTPETVPGLFGMLDDIIRQLSRERRQEF
jgi:DNA-binding MarR family transcriptional regulator